MRGLKKRYIKRGHKRNRQTNRHTLRLLDQLGPEGRVGENVWIICYNLLYPFKQRQPNSSMSAFSLKKKIKCHPGYSKLSMIANKKLTVKIVCHLVPSWTLQLPAVSPSSPLPAAPPGMLAGEGLSIWRSCQLRITQQHAMYYQRGT